MDGVLCEVQALSKEVFLQVVSRVKLLSGMDIADRRLPQDGHYTFDSAGRSLDARASTMPTIDGEKLVIRLLDLHADIPSLEDLGMDRSLAMRFRKRIHDPSGYLIICGPTGSGKTTSLYSALNELIGASQHVCSVEDPVEARIRGIAQVQVNVRSGLTFAAALRSLLRQDPNVIMVGEMRDDETASVSMSAALSGQLVLTTLHCSDAPHAVARLAELGVRRQAMAAT
jgi:type II secretory ATPase GspE/PulE/Tfp pilus assembly ATPase PilB-like protein